MPTEHVIRAGKSIQTVSADADDEQLAEMMVGHHVNFKLTRLLNLGKNILEVKDLHVNEDRGPKQSRVSISAAGKSLVWPGRRHGQDELVEAITGLRHVEGGQVVINGQDLTNKPVRQITEAGVGHIPADRQKYGLILQLPLSENIASQTYYKEPYSKHGIMNEQTIREHARELIKKFDVRTTSEQLPASDLSGGNQQKAIIARELDRDADLIIAFQPTRGLDVGAIEYIHSQLLKQRDAGKAVLLVSYELDEILQLSDRIVVLHDGAESGEVKPDQTSETELGLLMTEEYQEGGCR